MTNTQTAAVICDSYGEHSPRLTTFKLRYHRFIHSEFMTHRMLSRNASSSRAVPAVKLQEEVLHNDLRAAPLWWGAEKKGMQSGDLLIDIALDSARYLWSEAASAAARYAADMSLWGVHKSIVNRITEPFVHINVVATGVEDAWLNFFGLRLDKAAQPEMRILAELMWAAWNESMPKKLAPGEWHLPFVEDQDRDVFKNERWFTTGPADAATNGIIKISVARCARVSYLNHETQQRSEVSRDLELYQRLVGSQPLHASPAEHQATPDELATWPTDLVMYCNNQQRGMLSTWKHPDHAGNLTGYIQYRKTLGGERVAPLPEGYEYTWRKAS